MLANELLTMIVLICSPQTNKPVLNTCIIWIKQEVHYWQQKGFTDEQSLEIASELLPQELYPL